MAANTARRARVCCLDLDTFFVSVERLLDPSLVKLDLIDVNGEVGGFRRSSREARSAFLDVLARSGMPFAIRYSGGQEIAAGCGQLAASNDRKGSRVV